MLKWCEIGPRKTVRYEIFSKFLKTQGIDNEFHFIETPIENIESVLEQAQKDKLSIRFHPAFFDKLSGKLSNTFREFKLLNTVDSVILEGDDQHWPDIVLIDALSQFLAHKLKSLDVSQKVFCIGTCGVARAVLSGLIKLGFSDINITGHSREEAEQLISDFEKIYFNVSFEFTQRSDVTILPGVHGLVVNTLSPLHTEDFPSEVYYFNFLRKGGLVLDLVELPVATPFLKIASDIGAQTVSGYEALGFWDIVWLERAIGQRLPPDAYITHLKAELENVEYDKQKIQKILQDFQR